MLKRLKTIQVNPPYLVVGVALGIGSIIGLVIYHTVSFGSAVLVVESLPEAVVYVDDVRHGVTPIEMETSRREVSLKLVAEGAPLPLYSTKVKLEKNAKTIVRRRYGESEEQSMVQIIAFEKDVPGQASVSVVSIPDGVEVYLDGQKLGTTPLKLPVSEGAHTFEVVAFDYQKESFQVQVVKGYTVKIIVQLAKTVE